jgi:hypothetical protein
MGFGVPAGQTGFAGINGNLLADSWIDRCFIEFQGATRNHPNRTGSFFRGAYQPGLNNGNINYNVADRVGRGEQIFVNGVNDKDGFFNRHKFKSKIAGDADSGSLYTLSGFQEIIVHTSSAATHVFSASFQFSTSSRADATGSSTIKTLFFFSGSGIGSSASRTPEYSGLYGGEVGNQGSLGSPVCSDVDLRFNADVGFYSPSGSSFSSSFQVNTSSFAAQGFGPTYARLSTI